jgi:hypothetical protein
MEGQISKEQNKELIKKYQKEYRAKNQDRIKEYREQNKEKLSNYQKEYRVQNKDNNTEYQKEYRKIQFNCECGSCVSQGEKSSHFKTKKHLKYLETQK